MSGALSTTLLLALFAVTALRPPLPRRASPFTLSFALSWWINEAPAMALWWLLAGTLATLTSPEASVWWWLIVALSAVDVVLFASLAMRGRSARQPLSAALRSAYGPRAEPPHTPLPWWRLPLPVISWRPDVRRIRSRRYGPARRGHRLDVYVSRAPRKAPAPVLVYFHAGTSSKMIGAHPLIYRLAAGGWVCVSAARRQFHANGADQLDDVRAALAWVRRHAESYGGDPDRIVAAGGSAGAGLAAAAALTGSKVAALICLYGYYGLVGFDDAAGISQPATEVPPTFIIHGRLDTLVPAPQARAFADHLRAASDQPVVYAELPGTQHSFDVFHSVRFHAITDAIVSFTEVALRQAESSTC